jgi:hypothetical protein
MIISIRSGEADVLDFNDAASVLENVYSLPSKPNVEAMRAMVDMLFRMATKGRIELAWTSDVAPHTLNSARMFGPEDLEDLVDRAVRLNETPNRNVYVSAGLRRETVDSDHRATDADVFAVTAVKADFDAPGALDAAWRLLKERALLPNMVVITGNHPHMRGQMWWVLDEPTDDLEVARELERRLAIWLGGDKSIINPSRVMRLGGSVAWPLKAGRKVEVTDLITKTARQAAWGLEELKAAVREAVPVNANPAAPIDPMDFNTAGKQGGTGILERINKALHGEEWHNNVRDAVAHAVARGTPADIVVDLMAPLVVRAGYTIEETRRDIATMARGALAKGFAPDPEKPTEPDRPRLPILDVPGLLSVPDPTWIIDGWVIDDGVSVWYGPPKVYKTFNVLDMALSVACGVAWRGNAVTQQPVLYLLGEGMGTFKYRVHVWLEKRSEGRQAQFWTIPVGVPLSTPEGLTNALAAIDSLPVRPGLIVVDTLNRHFGPGDENSSQDMTRFVQAIDAIRAHTRAHIAVVHHSGKDAEKGARGSSALLGAVDNEFRITRTEGTKICRIECTAARHSDEPKPMTVELVPVEVTHAETGLVMSSLLPVLRDDGEADQGSKPAGKPLSKSARLVMTLLSEGPKFVKELVEETGLKRPTVQLILSDLAASKQVYSKEAEGAKLWYVLEAGGNTHA